MKVIDCWPGYLPDTASPCIHLWFRDEDSLVALRLCDGDTAPYGPEPIEPYGCRDMCRTCIEMWAVDFQQSETFIRARLDYHSPVTQL